MTAISVEPPIPASVDEMLRQGILPFQYEDWPQALTHFDAVARLRPHSGEVHNHRAPTGSARGCIGVYRCASHDRPVAAS